MAEDDAVNHPAHYGGADNVYEAIKVIRAWNLNFNLGNTAKYVCRAGRKRRSAKLEDLKKALWYLADEITALEADELAAKDFIATKTAELKGPGA